MCSAAWTFHQGGYEFAFNRDEKWVRPLSRDPQLEVHHPVPGACARDAAAGGTWLFANESGVTLAVMNAYPRRSHSCARKNLSWSTAASRRQPHHCGADRASASHGNGLEPIRSLRTFVDRPSHPPTFPLGWQIFQNPQHTSLQLSNNLIRRHRVRAPR